MIKPFYILKLLIIPSFLVLTSCYPAPWTAWKYKSVPQFPNYSDPWNLPNQDEYSNLYIDGAFVHVFFKAHDETTNSGSSPYRIFANVTTYNPLHKDVIFHSIKISDSEKNSYFAQPIVVNIAAKKINDLKFPVLSEFKGVQYSNQSPGSNSFTRATLWTDSTIKLKPKLGHEVTVTIDVEVKRAGKSTRDTVTYRFMPHRSGGLLQWISV